MKNIHKTKQRLNSTIKRIKKPYYCESCKERFDKKTCPECGKKTKGQGISDSDKELIFKFRDKAYTKDLTDTRVLFYLNKLQKLSEWTDKDLKDLEREDIDKLVAKINKKYDSEWTKQGYKIAIRKFFQWLDGKNWNSKKYPDKVEWISTTIKKNKNEDPDILTKEEVKKLIKTASSVRNKALISFLYESGARVGELLNIKIKDIEFDDYGAKVKLFGKTGERKVRLVGCVSRLRTWLEYHPNNQSSSYLWVSVGQKNHGNRMSYNTVRGIINNLIEEVGIDKDIHPHSFRHTRATHMAGSGVVNDAVMCEYFGWEQGSDMPSVYFHLSGEDTDRAILRMHGVKKDGDNEGESFTGLKCQICGKKNPPELNYCERCNKPLTEKAVTEKQNYIEKMMDKMLEKKLKQIEEGKK